MKRRVGPPTAPHCRLCLPVLPPQPHKLSTRAPSKPVQMLEIACGCARVEQPNAVGAAELEDCRLD